MPTDFDATRQAVANELARREQQLDDEARVAHQGSALNIEELRQRAHDAESAVAVAAAALEQVGVTCRSSSSARHRTPQHTNPRLPATCSASHSQLPHPLHVAGAALIPCFVICVSVGVSFTPFLPCSDGCLSTLFSERGLSGFSFAECRSVMLRTIDAH